jgi:hypothetical protein
MKHKEYTDTSCAHLAEPAQHTAELLLTLGPIGHLWTQRSWLLTANSNYKQLQTDNDPVRNTSGQTKILFFRRASKASQCVQQALHNTRYCGHKKEMMTSGHKRPFQA